MVNTLRSDNPRLAQHRILNNAHDARELEKVGYKLGTTLGYGNYGKVKIATTTQGQSVAVKIIDLKKATESCRQKFLPRELQILKQIDHPNIIKLHHIYHIDTKIYLILELASHGDLLDYIRLRGKLPEETARIFFSQTVNAVHYLHNQNVVHRDLKCENLLLDSMNCIKVSDFGFSRQMAPTDVSETYCGSPAYASPELMRGFGYSGVKNDMWSLGIILYIMVTGLMPYDDSDIPKLIRNQRRRLKFPNDDLSVYVQRLIRSLLEYNVHKRADTNQVLRAEWMQSVRMVSSVRQGEPHIEIQNQRTNIHGGVNSGVEMERVMTTE